MDDETFEHSLDRFGPDLDRWPGKHAAEAKRRVEQSVHAREAHLEAVELEFALDVLLPAVAAPLGLRARVLANLPEREVWLEWLAVKAWRPVALAMVPLVIGFGVGLNVAHGAATQSAVEDDVLLALFDPDELARYELPDTNTAERP